MSAARVTSAATPCGQPPPARISAARAPPFACVRPAANTSRPSRAKRWQSAPPSPAAAPTPRTSAPVVMGASLLEIGGACGLPFGGGHAPVTVLVAQAHGETVHVRAHAEERGRVRDRRAGERYEHHGARIAVALDLELGDSGQQVDRLIAQEVTRGERKHRAPVVAL